LLAEVHFLNTKSNPSDIYSSREGFWERWGMGWVFLIPG